MIVKITRAYVRHYSDSGQNTAYVERIDKRGHTGRTECAMDQCGGIGEHMRALFLRAAREGLTIEREEW